MESAQDILNRFYNFYDSLIESVRIDYQGENRTCKLTILPKDSMPENGCEWPDVILTIEGVRDFRLCETYRTSNQVLTDGIKIKKIENFFYIEFGGTYLDDCLNDNDKFLQEFWQSDAFVVGKSLSVTVNGLTIYSSTSAQPAPKDQAAVHPAINFALHYPRSTKVGGLYCDPRLSSGYIQSSNVRVNPIVSVHYSISED